MNLFSQLQQNAYTGRRGRPSLSLRPRWLLKAFATLPIILGVIAAESWPAQAQVLPGAVEPGRIEQDFQPGREPRAEPRDEEGAPEIEAPDGAEDVRFVLQRIEVVDSTVYFNSEFRFLYEDLIGQEVTLVDIYDVADGATALYRGDGYILSLVVVPPQEITDGVVELRAIEGFVDQVQVEGEIPGSKEYLERIGRQISENMPLNTRDLERYLLLIGDLPGIDARGVLAPSETVPGASDLTIVVEHDPVDGFGTADNRGSRFIGPYLFSVGVIENSNLGFYESFGIQASTAAETEELRFGRVTASVPVGIEGTAFDFSASFSESVPGFTLEPFDLDTSSFTWDVGVSHPVIRTREENLQVGLTFTWRDTRTNFNDNVLSDDEIRSLRAFAAYDFVDDWLGVNLIEASVTFGLPLFGSSDQGEADLSRPEASGEFAKFNATLTRLQRIIPGLAVLASATGQLSTRALLASEEFGFGGVNFGRGFDPSEITGEHGVATKLELQYGEALENDILNSYQVYTFFDAGFVWNDDAPTDAAEDNRASAGIGVRANVVDAVSLNLELAGQVLGGSASNDDPSDRDVRVLFGFVARF